MRTRIEPTAASVSKSAGGEAEPDCTLVYTGTLYRRRKGNSIALVNKPPPKPAPQGPSRQAIMLALAHKLQQAIDTGKVKDRAEVARRLGVTRARVTQIMDLALLPVGEQERVLMTELACAPPWSTPKRALNEWTSRPGAPTPPERPEGNWQ